MTTERKLDIKADDMLRLLAQSISEQAEMLTPLGEARLKIIILERMLMEKEAAEVPPCIEGMEGTYQDSVHTYVNGERVS